jgi:membrane protein YdbS with pleckstrin-like domain
MRFIKIILVLLYSFVYGYSVYMTKQEPERQVWGYICCLVFIIFTLWAIGEFIRYEGKNRQSDD